MTRTHLFKKHLVIIFIFLSLSLTGQINGFNKVKWDREKIATGLVWKSTHTLLCYD